MATSSITGLDAYFTNLISNLMVMERQPLTNLTEQKNALATQKAVYTDLQDTFAGLQDALDALRSSQASYNLKTGRKVSVTASDNATVVTATVGSEALAGNYSLSVSKLAKAHTARSAQQSSADQGLNLAGKILLGGAAARGQARQDATLTTVASFDVSDTTASGQKELGSGSFTVETRYVESSSQWQFRLVDAEGTAVSIRQGSSETAFGTGWQTFTEGQSYDTGRGLKINFAADDALFQANDRLNGAAATAYTAKGVELSITTGMSLNDIASSINALKFADGNEISASVVDRRLVLQAGKTGLARQMTATDVTGTFLQTIGMLNADNATFKTATAGQNALFTINGVEVERSSNNGLTNVLSGVRLNLAGDAEGKMATLSITADTSSARSAINAFISKFNALQTYLKNKTGVTKNADGTYTRGALASDMSLKGLGSSLYSRFTAKTTNDGIYTNLRQIGIDLEADLTAKVTDAAKLEDALTNHMSDVQSLMDAVMSSISAKTSMYSGDKGYAAQAKKTTENQIEYVDDRITALNERLEKTEERYTQQYAEIQAQLLTLSYMQQQWSSIYSYSSTLT